MADTLTPASFTFRLMKVALIVMHTLVAICFSLLVMMAFIRYDFVSGFILLLLEFNSWMAIVGAYRESRAILATTGTITLCLLILAMFTIHDRQSTTFPFIYFLTIVGLSYALSDMIRTREQMSHNMDPESHIPEDNTRDHVFPTAVPFTALVVGAPMRNTIPSRPVAIFAVPDPQTASFNDSPPPYEDFPPPKYEDVIKEVK